MFRMAVLECCEVFIIEKFENECLVAHVCPQTKKVIESKIKNEEIVSYRSPKAKELEQIIKFYKGLEGMEL
ncbi:MAG: hypothetical protein IE909_10660 [Campylobacterales bacterium]|nr:hypothetical protein [Campylobacterales bacterium]